MGSKVKAKLRPSRLFIIISTVLVVVGILAFGSWYYVVQNDKAQINEKFNSTIRSIDSGTSRSSGLIASTSSEELFSRFTGYFEMNDTKNISKIFSPAETDNEKMNSFISDILSVKHQINGNSKTKINGNLTTGKACYKDSEYEYYLAQILLVYTDGGTHTLTDTQVVVRSLANNSWYLTTTERSSSLNYGTCPDVAYQK